MCLLLKFQIFFWALLLVHCFVPQALTLIVSHLFSGLSWVTWHDDCARWLTGLLSFVSTVLLSTFILLFLPSSSVSLSNFYLAVPMRGCLGKDSCMSSPFPIAILNGTFSLQALILFCGDEPAIKTKLSMQTFIFRTSRLTGQDKVTRQHLFFSCPLCFFAHSFFSSYFLPLFNCLISILLFPCASVWENTRAWVPHFSVAILNGTCSLRAQMLFCGDVPALKN